MKVIVLNAGTRLDSLKQTWNGVDIKIRHRDDAASDLRSLSESQNEPFVLLWHKWADQAIPILLDLAQDWPPRLVACALFSSGRFANSASNEKDALSTVPEQLLKRLHICSSEVSDPVDNAVLMRFNLFTSELIQLSSASPEEIPFTLLDPAPPNGRIFSAQIATLIAEKKLCSLDAVINCIDWAEIKREPIFRGVTDIGSLARAAKNLPDQLKCPMCPKRSALRHALPKDPEPLAQLRGEKSSIGLKGLLAMDSRSLATREAMTLLILSNRCSQRKFVDAVKKVIEYLFEGRCALFVHRTELERILALAEMAIGNDLSPELKGALVSNLDCSPIAPGPDGIVKLRG